MHTGARNVGGWANPNYQINCDSFCPRNFDTESALVGRIKQPNFESCMSFCVAGQSQSYLVLFSHVNGDCLCDFGGGRAPLADTRWDCAKDVRFG